MPINGNVQRGRGSVYGTRTVGPIDGSGLTVTIAGIAVFQSGAGQSFVVPPGVGSIIAYLWSGGGPGGNWNSNQGGTGGQGALVVATLTVTPGETLTLDVAASQAPGTAGKLTAISRSGTQLAGAGGAGAGANGSGGGAGAAGSNSTASGASATDGSGTSAGTSLVPAGAALYTAVSSPTLYAASLFYPDMNYSNTTLISGVPPIANSGRGGITPYPPGGSGGGGYALITWGLTA